MSESTPTAVVIGAGPAGLTAALELLRRTNVKPIVLEASEDFGGISRTLKVDGNRMDIGGHRFFSKDRRVMDWWGELLPLENAPSTHQFDKHFSQQGEDPSKRDDVMLVRSRLSRIFFDRKFFNYPITLDPTTIKGLGLARVAKMGFSYIGARIKPRKENNLEDFYINRFGGELYRTFFRDYTEKVWGVPVNQIAADWGAQRVKGLSVSKTLWHAARKILKIGGKVETSLIEDFLYPKLGPGSMWEKAADLVKQGGGEIITNATAVKINVHDGKATSVTVKDSKTGDEREIKADYVLSSMPVRELVAGLAGDEVPAEVREVAEGLVYRDFVTVGVLAKQLTLQDGTGQLVKDNWIYIQEPDVKVGRLQIFNNWSPYLVQDPDNTVWMGMEYFADEGDGLWTMPDDELMAFAISELEKIGVARASDIIRTNVQRVPKAYPAYFGTYDQFQTIRDHVDPIGNLFLVGRNGQHRYNNQDHSMLTAMAAVDQIAKGSTDKTPLWAVNADQEYHEGAADSDADADLADDEGPDLLDVLSQTDDEESHQASGQVA